MSKPLTPSRTHEDSSKAFQSVRDHRRRHQYVSSNKTNRPGGTERAGPGSASCTSEAALARGSFFSSFNRKLACACGAAYNSRQTVNNSSSFQRRATATTGFHLVRRRHPLPTHRRRLFGHFHHSIPPASLFPRGNRAAALAEELSFPGRLAVSPAECAFQKSGETRGQG